MSQKKQEQEVTLLSAEAILAAEDIKTVDVNVPEWGGTVRLRTLTGEEAMRFAESVTGENRSESAVRIVGLCAIKDDGTPLFTEEQLTQLKQKSLRAIMRLQREAMTINGFTEEEAEAAKND